jgi:hypothetical protein
LGTYADLHQIILDDTKRDDMGDPAIVPGGSGVIKRRIQRSLLRFHRLDFWRKDFNIQEYAFQQSQVIQIINLALFPRLRAVGFIRKYDPSLASQYNTSTFGLSTGQAFEEINPEKMLDGYGYDRRDTMYRAGDEVHLNSSIALASVLIGWFQDPQINPIETSQSWILTDYQDLLCADVKMRIYKDIGKDEERNTAREELLGEIALLQTNNVRLSVM